MMDRRKRARLKRVLGSMRLNFIAFAALIVIAVIGISLIRSTLFDNAWETGTSMARNYAAEEQSSLTMYETLLTFGTASIDDRTKQGWSREEMRQWTDIYFARLDSVLGEGVVDPYVVLDGEIIAAHPWDVDETYDVESTEWYQRAVAADALDRGGLADGQLFQCRQSSVSSQGWRGGGRSASSEVFRLPPPFRFSSSVTAHYKGFGETAQQARSARNQSGMKIEQRRWSGDENQPPWHRFYPIERRNPLLAEVFIPNGFRWMKTAPRRQGANGRRRPSSTSFPDEAIRRCLM